MLQDGQGVSTWTFPLALPAMIGEGESTAFFSIKELPSVRVLCTCVQQPFISHGSAVGIEQSMSITSFVICLCLSRLMVHIAMILNKS